MSQGLCISDWIILKVSQGSWISDWKILEVSQGSWISDWIILKVSQGLCISDWIIWKVSQGSWISDWIILKVKHRSETRDWLNVKSVTGIGDQWLDILKNATEIRDRRLPKCKSRRWDSGLHGSMTSRCACLTIGHFRVTVGHPRVTIGAKSYFVQSSTDCLVKGSPGEMTL